MYLPKVETNRDDTREQAVMLYASLLIAYTTLATKLHCWGNEQQLALNEIDGVMNEAMIAVEKFIELRNEML